MRNLFVIVIISSLLVSCLKEVKERSEIKNADYGIVIHGGAGYMVPEWYSEEQIKAYEEKLNEALKTGQSILKNGGTSLDAVEATIKILEDSPLFNAGKGAVFTSNGKNELDAAIMNGADLNCGAVAGVTTTKNPISLARLVMEKSKHVFMAREGAEKFGRANGIETVDPEYFYTDKAWHSLQKAKEKELENEKLGTVGCAALDKHGNLAAGTSTGGMTNKRFGRIGDVPVIGAGTYANNATCAISCTGHGEFFIRNVVAHDISALMEYKGLTFDEASEKVINDKLVKVKGDGGMIGIDRNGNVAMKFNTKGMFRGFILEDGKPVIKIFKD
ncbi:MAG: isoaspartyl peptidase/L-asparaginase [Melioribacteraceae bacterium]|nr:isoaspartyl peptidase/L-asparaginase [Melioribacteraceae bacterium]